jgi:hypothetical protein
MPLMDFSSVEKEINDAQAPHLLDKGTEAEVRIIGINEGVSEKSGARWFMPRFDVPKDPMAVEFNAFFFNPLDNAKLDEKQRQKNDYNFQQFVKCFKVDLTKPFSFEDLIGKKGWVILGIQKDDQYGDKNSISRYVAGQSVFSSVELPLNVTTNY